MWNEMSFKAEIHFRTTSIKLLGYLIDDGAIKCVSSILNDVNSFKYPVGFQQ